jgi:hypothetical protein
VEGSSAASSRRWPTDRSEGASHVSTGPHQRNQPPVEPRLPIEKKLIGWSLGIGIALLIAFNHFVPIKL